MTSTTKKHKLYFGPGPAALPEEVLKQASEAIVDYNDSGLSILEIPHRGKLFDSILEESTELVKELCELDDDHHVLWMHGGGRLQFSMIPMNFLPEHGAAGYLDTGYWAHVAAKYAAYYGRTEILASSREANYAHLPPFPSHIPADISYLHYTTNNTIYGTQWAERELPGIPVISDMSSDILSRKRNYKQYSMFYACAQKNIGPAGVTLAVVRKDMLGKIERTLPPMLSYAEHVKHNSVLNTPPVFAIYTSLLMLRWTKEKTVNAIQRENEQKAALLYSELQSNSVFTPNISINEHRSQMNVCFQAVNQEAEKGFIQLCEQHNVTGLEGHRTAGGFRVSLYNAIPLSSVQTLIGLMQEYEQEISKL